MASETPRQSTTYTLPWESMSRPRRQTHAPSLQSRRSSRLREKLRKKLLVTQRDKRIDSRGPKGGEHGGGETD